MKTVIVLLIFAKWCGHCTDFKPTWDAFVKENASHNDVDMMEIEDAELNTKLDELNRKLFGGADSQEKIDGGRGFPTLVKVEGGKISYFEEERTPESIAKWIGHSVKVPTTSLQMKGGKKIKRCRLRTGKRGKYSRRCGTKNRKTRRAH